MRKDFNLKENQFVYFLTKINGEQTYFKHRYQQMLLAAQGQSGSYPGSCIPISSQAWAQYSSDRISQLYLSIGKRRHLNVDKDIELGYNNI